MKKISALIMIVTLSACVFGQKVETGLSGCSLLGLQALDFYSGQPSKGKKMKSETAEDGMTVWTFGYDSGDIYAVCGYMDEEEIVQMLPPSVTSCKASFNGTDKTVSDLSCEGRI